MFNIISQGLHMRCQIINYYDMLHDMWAYIMNLFDGKKETRFLVSSVDEQVISDAYRSLEGEIDSLSKYDRGEKKIDAPDLRTTLRHIR